MAFPPCGIYRTTQVTAGIEAGRLVYFHNHGNPGPGVYLPEGWHLNRAKFAERGHTLTSAEQEAHSLKALPSEGFYRVQKEFTCCDKKCRIFVKETLLQLGYNGAGQAIVFEPEWQTNGIALPTTGQGIDDTCLESLAPLKVRVAQALAQPDHLH